MLWRWPTRVRLRHQRLDLHQAHETLDALAIDDQPLAAHRSSDTAAPVERELQVQLVDTPHQREIFRVRTDALVVQARSVDPEDLALATHRGRFVRRDKLATDLHRSRSSPLAKKSRSTVNSPIFFTTSASPSLVPPLFPSGYNAPDTFSVS